MRNTFVIQEEVSLVQENTAITLQRPVVLVPIFSPKGYGDDDQLRFLTSLADLAKYGDVDYDHFGISMIVAKKVLANGGTALVQRLTNAGDLCANIICNVVQDSTDVDDFAYTLALASGVGVSDYSALVTAVEGELDVASATKTYPLFGLMYRSKGTAGNKISVRLTVNADLSDHVGAKVYTLEIYENGVQLYELYGTFTRQAFGASPLYFPEVVRMMTDEFLMYIPPVDEMVTAIEAVTTGTFAELDILGGDADDHMIKSTSLDFTAINGVSLASGSFVGTVNGVNKFTDANVITEVESLLTNFFNGTKNPQLFNRLKYPIDIIFDPGYAIDVNKAIINNLLVKNEGIQFFMNMPKSTTFTAAKAAASSTYTDVSGTNITVYGNYFGSFMEETSRYMEVPATLFAIDQFINCFKEGIPFAGKANIQVNGFDKIVPSIFEKDEVDELIKYRVNMFTENGIGTARPESEMTYRLKLIGALSSTSNRIVLNDMMKIADEMSEDNAFLPGFNYDKYAEALRDRYLLAYKSQLSAVEVTARKKGGNGLDQNNAAVTIAATFNNTTDGFQHTFVVKSN